MTQKPTNMQDNSWNIAVTCFLVFLVSLGIFLLNANGDGHFQFIEAFGFFATLFFCLLSILYLMDGK